MDAGQEPIQVQPEFTVRAALSAGPARVLRHLLTESLLLALAGGSVGMGVAAAAVKLVEVIGPKPLPRLHEAGLNFHVFGFDFAITVVTSILCGLAPALGTGRTNLAESLKESGGATESTAIRVVGRPCSARRLPSDRQLQQNRLNC